MTDLLSRLANAGIMPPLPSRKPSEAAAKPAPEIGNASGGQSEANEGNNAVNSQPSISPTFVQQNGPKDTDANIAELQDAGDNDKSGVVTATAPTPLNLDWALGYARAGHPVFPLAPGSKVPCEGSSGLSDATTDEATIRCLWGANPNAGVAIRCDNMAVLDVDPRNGGAETLAALEAQHGPLPATRKQITARRDGGSHRVLQKPDGNFRKKRSDCPGLDFLTGPSFYIVAEPTVIACSADHPGGRYEWDRSCVGLEPAEAPAWLLDLFRKAAEPSSEAAYQLSDIQDAPAEVVDRAKAYVSHMGPAIEGQGGGAKTFQMFQRCWGLELSCPQAWQVGCEFNQNQCQPMWTEGDLRRQLENVYDTSRGYNNLPFGFMLKTEAEDAAMLGDVLAKVSRAVQSGAPEDRELERGDHAELACLLRGQITSSEAPAVYADGSIYRYDDARHTFSPLDEHDLGRRVQGYAGRWVVTAKTAKPLRINSHDVSGTISCTRNLLSQPDFFNGAKPGLAFTNGFLEVSADGLQLHPHSPDNKARFAYEFEYDASANDPEGLNWFLRDVWRDDPDVESKIALLQEFAGAMIFGLGTRFQKATVLTGDGNNGKGVTFTILEAIMPSGSVCSVAPQDMCNEYYRAKIMGKLANMVSELPKKVIAETEAFKAFIAGDLLTVRPIREAPYDGRPTATHLYSCNTLPGTTDTSHAFWRRWLILTYNRIYDPSEEIHNLAEKILEHDRAAIVVWAARGAVRLLKNKGYTVPPSSLRALEAWKGSANVVKLFVDECCDPVAPATAKKDWAPAKQVYERFRMWCDDQGIPERLSSIQFGDRMRQIKLLKSHSEAAWVFPITLKQQVTAPFAAGYPLRSVS